MKLYFAGPGIEGSAQIAALVISLVVLFLLASVLFLVLRRRKKQKETEDEDENPVYGMYEFADGRNIDEGRSEFVDDNENYGL